LSQKLGLFSEISIESLVIKSVNEIVLNFIVVFFYVLRMHGVGWNVFSYCAMQFSAKRGLAIACRPSVRASVTLVDCDHIGC